jgi:hypothetical protein
MAERIIDCLEAIEVDHHEPAAATPLVGLGQCLAQCFGQLEAVGQTGQRVETRKMRNLLCRLALFGNVRTHAAESKERTVIRLARRCRQLPPSAKAVDGYRHDDVGKGLAPFQLFGKVVQFFGIAPRLPRITGNQLEQRLPLDDLGFGIKRARKTGAGMRDAAAGIGLPEPVGPCIFKFAQQEADRFRFFVQDIAGQFEQHLGLCTPQHAEHHQRPQCAGSQREVILFVQDPANEATCCRHGDECHRRQRQAGHHHRRINHHRKADRPDPQPLRHCTIDAEKGQRGAPDQAIDGRISAHLPELGAGRMSIFNNLRIAQFPEPDGGIANQHASPCCQRPDWRFAEIDREHQCAAYQRRQKMRNRAILDRPGLNLLKLGSLYSARIFKSEQGFCRNVLRQFVA